MIRNPNNPLSMQHIKILLTNYMIFWKSWQQSSKTWGFYRGIENICGVIKPIESFPFKNVHWIVRKYLPISWYSAIFSVRKSAIKLSLIKTYGMGLVLIVVLLPLSFIFNERKGTVSLRVLSSNLKQKRIVPVLETIATLITINYNANSNNEQHYA